MKFFRFSIVIMLLGLASQAAAGVLTEAILEKKSDLNDMTKVIIIQVLVLTIRLMYQTMRKREAKNLSHATPYVVPPLLRIAKQLSIPSNQIGLTTASYQPRQVTFFLGNVYWLSVTKESLKNVFRFLISKRLEKNC